MPVISKLIFVSNVIPVKILIGFIWFVWNVNSFQLASVHHLKNKWAKASFFSPEED